MDFNSLKIHKVEYCYPTQKKNSLQEVSFNVFKNDKIGIIGKNGSGKSTLIKILASLLEPTSGELFFNDVPLLKNLGKYRKLIHYTSGAPLGFYPRLSGIENLQFFSGLQGQWYTKVDVTRVLERVGLSKESWDKKYFAYSLGMKQRLHIARFFLPIPEILILDEPTNGLDVSGRELLIKILKEDFEQSALLVVSHDQDFISEVTTQTVKLS